MTFAWGDSFDCYAAPADALNGYWDSGTLGASGALVAGRFSGSNALSLASASTSTAIKSSGVNDSVHHLVVAFKQTAAISGTTLANYLELFDGVTAQCSVVFRSDGAILLTSGGPAGTALATYAGAFPVINTWYAFEIEVIVHNSTGSFKVRKNGNTVDDHSTTGIDTAGGTANNYANKLQIGQQAALAGGQVFDDLYWRSDASSVAWMGDIKCMARAPASDASVQFSRTPTGVLTQSVNPGTQTNTAGTNVAFYTAFVAAYSGTVTGVGVAFAALGTSTTMECAIFADNGSGTGPGAILSAATGTLAPVVGTNAFTFTGVSVVKGATYWVGAAVDGNGSFTTSVTSFANGCRGTSSLAVFPQANPVVVNPAPVAWMNWIYTATPANWQAVSEAQQDATTSYVYDSVPGHTDFYTIAPIASTPLTTFAVTTRAYMIKSDAGTRTAAVQLRSGGTTVASPTIVLTPSNWQWAWRHDTSDPAGGAWTAAAVNVATVGPTVIA